MLSTTMSRYLSLSSNELLVSRSESSTSNSSSPLFPTIESYNRRDCDMKPEDIYSYAILIIVIEVKPSELQG